MPVFIEKKVNNFSISRFLSVESFFQGHFGEEIVQQLQKNSVDNIDVAIFDIIEDFFPVVMKVFPFFIFSS
jgi:hypothetical protein